MTKRNYVNGILLLYHHPLIANASTIMENVRAFARYSEFKVWQVNTELGFPKALDYLNFEVIILHYSLFGTDDYKLSPHFREFIENSGDSYKIAIFQDEYHHCQQRFAFINDYNINCVYTCLEPSYFGDVYQKYTKVPRLISYIPGYVSDELVQAASRLTIPFENRMIDVGYRGRKLPFYMGKAAQEKVLIAEGFRQRAEGLGLSLNLATSEQKRLYGEEWYKFNANCKAVLGVESGVSVFDTEDMVYKEYLRITKENPYVEFEDLSKLILEDREDRIYYRTISPRHFEAAAFRVCQILYEGNYSGILKPMVHYIPLAKDFSNFDKVIKIFRDESTVKEMIENTYEDLIASGKYSYQNFIRDFDQALFEDGLSKEISTDTIFYVDKMLKKDYQWRQIKGRIKRLKYYNFPGRNYVAKVYRQLSP